MNQKLFLLITFIWISSSTFAQNLISNPDFENYSTCPTMNGDIANAIDWFDVVQSSDYVNCQYTGWATQQTIGAQSGFGYAGFASYGSSIATETIGQVLTTPLIAGDRYNLLFYAKRTPSGSYSQICGGVCFYGWVGNPILSSNFIGICPDSIHGAVFLGCTDTIINPLWQPYRLAFTASDNFDFIGMCAACNTASSGQYINVDNFNLTSTVTDVANISPDIKLSVSPNPAIDLINISCMLSSPTDLEIILNDALGKAIFTNSRHLISGKVNINVETSNIANGIYFLKVNASEKEYTRKIILAH